MLSVLAFHLVVVVYSAAAVLFLVDVARPGAERPPGRHAVPLLALAVALHALHLGGAVAVGLHEARSLRAALSLCGLALAAAQAGLGPRLGVGALAVATVPVALTLYVAAEFLPGSSATAGPAPVLLILHVAANVLGTALFLLAGTASGFFLLQERRLKAKRVRGGHRGRLPALDALDRTEHRFLVAGFPLLTFGIVTGAVFVARAEALGGASLARAVLATATWLLVAGVLILRATLGWRGRRAAYGTLAGVLCVVLVLGVYVGRAGGAP